jgi:hypothetical protein
LVQAGGDKAGGKREAGQVQETARGKYSRSPHCKPDQKNLSAYNVSPLKINLALHTVNLINKIGALQCKPEKI